VELIVDSVSVSVDAHPRFEFRPASESVPTDVASRLAWRGKQVRMSG